MFSSMEVADEVVVGVEVGASSVVAVAAAATLRGLARK